jgi:hypothetical protein
LIVKRRHYYLSRGKERESLIPHCSSHQSPPPTTTITAIPYHHHHNHHHPSTTTHDHPSPPQLKVTAFLLDARRAGHFVDSSGASQVMQAACAQRTCHVPLDVSGFAVDVQVGGKGGGGVGGLMILFTFT